MSLIKGFGSGVGLGQSPSSRVGGSMMFCKKFPKGTRSGASHIVEGMKVVADGRSGPPCERVGYHLSGAVGGGADGHMMNVGVEWHNP